MERRFAKKIEAVKKLSNIITEYQDNVEKVEYKVFEIKQDDRIYYEEFIIITYIGGAYTSIRSSTNSFSAILRIISQYLDNGNYDHRYYLYCKENGKELED